MLQEAETYLLIVSKFTNVQMLHVLIWLDQINYGWIQIESNRNLGSIKFGSRFRLRSYALKCLDVSGVWHLSLV